MAENYSRTSAKGAVCVHRPCVSLRRGLILDLQRTIPPYPRGRRRFDRAHDANENRVYYEELIPSIFKICQHLYCLNYTR